MQNITNILAAGLHAESMRRVLALRPSAGAGDAEGGHDRRAGDEPHGHRRPRRPGNRQHQQHHCPADGAPSLLPKSPSPPLLEAITNPQPCSPWASRSCASEQLREGSPFLDPCRVRGPCQQLQFEHLHLAELPLGLGPWDSVSHLFPADHAALPFLSAAGRGAGDRRLRCVGSIRQDPPSTRGLPLSKQAWPLLMVCSGSCVETLNMGGSVQQHPRWIQVGISCGSLSLKPVRAVASSCCQ